MVIATEFTEQKYSELVLEAVSKYHFDGSDFRSDVPSVCWRHDVDYSPHRALAMAKIEGAAGAKCVYHFLCSSRYYNILEPEISNICREIVSLGHEIGLHFDMDVLGSSPVTESFLLDRVLMEKNLLSQVLGCDLVSFSFHNHVLHLEKIVESELICGMRNLASPKFYEQAKYLSDSNGIWRGETLKELLSGPCYPKLHILTHPVWWTPDPLVPVQCVSRAVEGRAVANKTLYIKIMQRDGRLTQIGELIGLTEQDLQLAGLNAHEKLQD
ncbi:MULTISPECIES: hypothetical protein [unclassified Thalassospira]|uniref:hypothetical protein n=1 Tax=unclassified Thalassospira TaxID=2648997 RepID=UPI001B14FEAC|nr:hypothetical protein [Thalassospira sp.]MBO6769740.1 hypothetical protein [Thalassospira sp.]